MIISCLMLYFLVSVNFIINNTQNAPKMPFKTTNSIFFLGGSTAASPVLTLNTLAPKPHIFPCLCKTMTENDVMAFAEH